LLVKFFIATVLCCFLSLLLLCDGQQTKDLKTIFVRCGREERSVHSSALWSSITMANDTHVATGWQSSTEVLQPLDTLVAVSGNVQKLPFTEKVHSYLSGTSCSLTEDDYRGFLREVALKYHLQ